MLDSLMAIDCLVSQSVRNTEMDDQEGSVDKFTSSKQKSSPWLPRYIASGRAGSEHRLTYR